jgi:hypothetical protein
MNTYAIILSIINSIASLQTVVMKLRETARQNRELTADEDAKLDAKLRLTFSSEYWVPSDRSE